MTRKKNDIPYITRPDYKNVNFDYDDIEFILNLKKNEYKKVTNIVDIILDNFKTSFGMDYGISKEVIMSSDIDYSLLEKIRIDIKNTIEVPINRKKPDEVKKRHIQTIFLDFPCLDDYAMFNIHGVKRTPCIQLIDKPLVIRKDRIRFQSNVDIMELHFKDFILKTTFMKKSGIHFMTYLMATWGPKKCQEKLGFILDIDEPNESLSGEHLRNDIVRIIWKKDVHWRLQMMVMSIFDWKLYDLGDKFNKYKSISSAEFWRKQINKHIKENQKGSSFDHLKSSMSSILKIDIFTAQYVQEESVEEEIIRGLSMEPFNELDVRNKRIRCIEYMLSDFIKYMHTLYVNLDLGRRIYYINDIKIFKLDDFVINARLSVNEYQFNPLTELSEYSKITQIGPLGFIRDYFRGRKRDIHFSQRGLFCPVSTPDRENCGVILHMVAGSKNRDFSTIYKPIINFKDPVILRDIDLPEVIEEIPEALQKKKDEKETKKKKSKKSKESEFKETLVINSL